MYVCMFAVLNANDFSQRRRRSRRYAPVSLALGGCGVKSHEGSVTSKRHGTTVKRH